MSIVEAPKAFHHDFSLPLVSSVERRFYLNRRKHVNTIFGILGAGLAGYANEIAKSKFSQKSRTVD